MLISCWNHMGMDDDVDDGEAFALGMMDDDDDDASLVLSTISPRSQDEEEDDDDVVAIDGCEWAARADGRANAANENAVAGTNRSRMGMRCL